MINDKPEKIDKVVGKPCKFGCGINIFWHGFDKTIKYDTGWREVKYPEVAHTFQRCFDIQKENEKNKSDDISVNSNDTRSM